MASFVADIGEAIATAITSGSSYFTAIGGLNAEYGDQPKDYNVKTGRAYIRSEGMEIISQVTGSARSVFRYSITVALLDVRAANEAMGVVQQGLQNVFANDGNAILNTHLSDSGSNRLVGGGTCRVMPEVTPLEGLTNRDAPIIRARCEVECWHSYPLA